jgi:hypothetical protein
MRSKLHRDPLQKTEVNISLGLTFFPVTPAFTIQWTQRWMAETISDRIRRQFVSEPSICAKKHWGWKAH